MLILGRKSGESISIGDDITISIKEISKNMVKIGIEAPKDLIILRSELKDKIIQQNKKATKKSDIVELKKFSKLLKK